MLTTLRIVTYHCCRVLPSVAAALVLLFSSAAHLRGQTWTPTSAPLKQWKCMASSADGARLVAATGEGPIYVSNDAGATWTSTTLPTTPPGTLWNGVACSADGAEIIAAGFGAQVYLSTNWGVTWTGTPFYDGFQGVACSADGSKIIAVGWNDGLQVSSIYTSTNSGTSWAVTTQTNSPLLWESAATSADGTTMIAGSFAGVWISTNSGAAWVTNNLN